jgi:hypothetical protein
MKEQRPPFSQIPVQPGERFLTLIGRDYWNTEENARRVAAWAEEYIEELERTIFDLLEVNEMMKFRSILPELKDEKVTVKCSREAHQESFKHGHMTCPYCKTDIRLIML